MKTHPLEGPRKKILNQPNLELPNYIKPPNLILKKKPKKEMEVG